MNIGVSFTEGGMEMSVGTIRKPPIGVITRELWLEERLKELKRCITEYIDGNFRINTEWIVEYNKLIKELDDYDNGERKENT